jgi:hypothetical protein
MCHSPEASITTPTATHGVTRPAVVPATGRPPRWLAALVLDNTDSPGRGESIEYVLLEGLPSVAWIANLAALKLHVN